MRRAMIAAVLVLGLGAGGLWADDTVKSFKFDDKELMVKTDTGQEKTLRLAPDVIVYDVQGARLNGERALVGALKEGVRVKAEEKAGKVVELRIVKK
jgi:hypothetical protein